jgi:serine/threonine-protein kinase HipA
VGRKRQGRVLDVYVGLSKVGRYSREPSGATSFRYDPDWLSSERAFPISLSMPLSDRVWSGERATSYFDGLLPDDRTVREKIATREHADSAGIFDLLAVIGRDCGGENPWVRAESCVAVRVTLPSSYACSTLNH